MSRLTSQKKKQYHKPLVKVLRVSPAFGSYEFITTNCIILHNGSQAVVVDPGGESDKILWFLKKHHLSVSAYWLTHGHPDHVLGLSKILKINPAPVRYHTGDSKWLSLVIPVTKIRYNRQFSPFCRKPTLCDGGISAQVIRTPGHSNGSVCYWLKDIGILLAGDTVFKNETGATVIPGGSEAK